VKTHHIAAGEDLTRPLTQTEFETLNALGLISPCHNCTQMLGEPDDVVYHPDISGTRTEDEALDEIEAVLSPKKH
jgi:hypothetical protein